METVDREKMCKLLYPYAVKSQKNGILSVSELNAAIGASAEGYSFPVNLDHDPPSGGLAPETQQALFMRAITENLSFQNFVEILDEMRVKRFT